MKYVSILDSDNRLIAQLFEENGDVKVLSIDDIKCIVDGEVLTRPHNAEVEEEKEIKSE